ncbi:MAG: alpha/beta hydrolase [Bacteroidota bacterium]
MASLLPAQEAFQVETQGTGDPIVLIPGLASSAEVWTATLQELHANYHCHALTLAGFAQQKPLDQDSSFLPLVQEAMTSYLETFEQPVTLIGHSLGGFLGLAVALERPELVERLIIVDAYPFYSSAMQPGITVDQVRGQADFYRQSLKAMNKEYYAQQQKQTIPILVRDSLGQELVLRWSLASDQSTVAQAMYELMTTDLRPQLSALNVPTLVLGAGASGQDYGLTQEALLERIAAEYAAAMDQVNIELAPNAYHFIMLDEPAWFMEQVQEFLKQ